MKLIFDNHKKSIPFQGKVADLLRKLCVSREEVVVKINGRLAPETEKVGAKDTVEVIKVVFGG